MNSKPGFEGEEAKENKNEKEGESETEGGREKARKQKALKKSGGYITMKRGQPIRKCSTTATSGRRDSRELELTEKKKKRRDSLVS